MYSSLPSRFLHVSLSIFVVTRSASIFGFRVMINNQRIFVNQCRYFYSRMLIIILILMSCHSNIMLVIVDLLYRLYSRIFHFLVEILKFLEIAVYWKYDGMIFKATWISTCTYVYHFCTRKTIEVIAILAKRYTDYSSRIILAEYILEREISCPEETVFFTCYRQIKIPTASTLAEGENVPWNFMLVRTDERMFY